VRNFWKKEWVLASVHSIFIVFSYAVAIFTPFYIGILLILAHFFHELKYGDCILTILKRRYGFALENEDFFHYLFRKMGFNANPKFTKNIHHFIKTTILFIVVYKGYLFFAKRFLVII
jgi:hypothetical protein